jgi:hypothetical protein
MSQTLHLVQASPLLNVCFHGTLTEDVMGDFSPSDFTFFGSSKEALFCVVQSAAFCPGSCMWRNLPYFAE